MEIIRHRINKIKDLNFTTDGAEIDIRGAQTPQSIFLQHDNIRDGDSFEDFLKNWKSTGTLILDIKEERLEWNVIELLKKYNIKNYFFLDCSFPMIVALTNSGENNVAIRFSEYEGLDTVINMAGKAKWVWVDTFTRNPLTQGIAEGFHKLGYKICFVSPELQGQPEKREEYINEVKDYVDAICTDCF